jgi:VacB/RNase II family 3'-5' exoribonuclease
MKESASGHNLRSLARRAMINEGFAPELPPQAIAEAEAVTAAPAISDAAASPVDLTALLWSSIDNVESRDLDQIEFVEPLADGGARLLVGIADVDALAPQGSAIDRFAAQNTTSVYTGVETFPMLPEQLSTDRTSLLGEVERLAIIIELELSESGSLRSSKVYRARVRNQAQLDYETVGAWLEGGGPVPKKVAAVAGLEDQLRLQDRLAARLAELRRQKGALDFETVEASPVTRDDAVIGLTVRPKNRARTLIENFMVTANEAMATYLHDKGLPAIQRVVKTPERWPRIVEIAEQLGDALPAEPDARALADFLARQKAADAAHFPDLSLSIVKLLGAGEYAVVRADAESAGHFGLAAHDYTHSTAPNRRFVDLITQRLLKAALADAPEPYDEARLADIADHCTERQSAARKVERVMRKVIAAALLHDRIGESFDAIVTGASGKGTFVRLIAPPAEGRVVRGEQGMDVGDRVRVRLVSTSVEKGFIDFEPSRS